MVLSPKTTHFPQLDGLRAVAVLMVIICHTLPYCNILGGAGVRIFFVLSGFLITGILLNLRGADLGAALASFYARRSLRIFPLYFLALGLCAIGGLREVMHYWPWLVTYTSNIRMALLGHINQGSVSHFWSLAVEEQFYLVWPFLILLAPRRALPWIIGGCVALALATRLIAVATEQTAVLFQMPACMDSLALGSWLAWRREENLPPLSCRHVFMLGAGLVAVSELSAASSVFYQLGEAILALALVSRATENQSSVWDRVLQWKPLMNLGVISYGLYVWHGIVYPIVLTETCWYGFALVFSISLALSLLSWYLVEKPLNQLRHSFPYPVRGSHAVPIQIHGQDRRECVPC